MSVRRAELARMEAAGWTVIVDSPWRRLAVAAVRLILRLVDRRASTRGSAPDASADGWSR